MSALDSLLLLLSSCFTSSFFPFGLGPKISGRDLLLVEESCNAPDSMRQVSSSYSPSLPCHLLACCIFPCHHVHFILHTCSSHASELFPRCPFCNPALLCSPASPFCLFSCAGVKRSRNGPRFAKRPWYSTSRPPVKFRAIWRSFDTPTFNRVTVKASFVCSPTPLPKRPKTQQTPLHALGRSITIVWPKTVLHLDSPSSLYL